MYGQLSNQYANPWSGYSGNQGYGGYGNSLNQIGGSLYGMFNNKNPFNAASPYLNSIPGQLSPYMNPYMQAGQNALGNLQGQYGQMTSTLPGLESQYGKMAGMMPDVQSTLGNIMKDPGTFINNMGKGFQQSPGLAFQEQQATNAANRASAAGGMEGSPAEQQQIGGVINNMAQQNYGQWMDRALGEFNQGLSGGMNVGEAGLQGQNNLFNRGIQGEEGLNQMGYGANSQMMNAIQDMLYGQANNATAGANYGNQSSGFNIGNLLSGISNFI